MTATGKRTRNSIVGWLAITSIVFGEFLDIWEGRRKTVSVIPAKAGIQPLFDMLNHWTPAFAGVTAHDLYIDPFMERRTSREKF